MTGPEDSGRAARRKDGLLSYGEVVARHLEHQLAMGLVPNTVHAWRWVRDQIGLGLLTVVSDDEEARRTVRAVRLHHHDPRIDSSLRWALGEVVFFEAEVEALLPGEGETEPATAPEPAGQRRGPKPKDIWPKVLGHAAAWLAANGAPKNQADLEKVIVERIEAHGNGISLARRTPRVREERSLRSHVPAAPEKPSNGAGFGHGEPVNVPGADVHGREERSHDVHALCGEKLEHLQPLGRKL